MLRCAPDVDWSSMSVIGFVPLGAVTVAAAAAALLGLSQGPDGAPWEGDRGDLPVGTLGTHPDLSAELGCTTAIESGEVDFGGTPVEYPAPDEQAARWATFITENDEAATADWTYTWRDLTQSTGAMLVYDPDSTSARPRTIVYFEEHDGVWLLTGGDKCSDS